MAIDSYLCERCHIDLHTVEVGRATGDGMATVNHVELDTVLVAVLDLSLSLANRQRVFSNIVYAQSLRRPILSLAVQQLGSWVPQTCSISLSRLHSVDVQAQR